MLLPDPDELAAPAHAGLRVGERVFVARDPGLAPAPAIVIAGNHHRPHLVKVQYVRSRAAAWIARARIVSCAES
jgi:hypothetical protein